MTSERMTLRAEFLDDFGPEWRNVDSVEVGRRTPAGEVAARVGVTVDGSPRLRVDVFANYEHEAFREVRCIAPVAAIGYGGHVYFVDVETRAAKPVELSGYFGTLYTPEDFGLADCPFDFLVGSADALHRFAADGSLVWTAEDVAIDGVIVHDIVDGVIDGTGEWDPPGGWKEFRLDLDTGARIA
jgi:hypothetical protein